MSGSGGKHGLARKRSWRQARLARKRSWRTRRLRPVHNRGAWVRGWSRWGAKLRRVGASKRIHASKRRACVSMSGRRGKHGWVRGRLVPHSTPIVRSTGPEQNGGTWVRGWSRWGAKQLGVDPSARILASQSSACVCQCGDSMDRWVRGRLADWSGAVHCHWPTGTWVRGWSRSCAKLLKPAGK
jgi:hypothetical protein